MHGMHGMHDTTMPLPSMHCNVVAELPMLSTITTEASSTCTFQKFAAGCYYQSTVDEAHRWADICSGQTLGEKL
jgi:hypothetical protein